MDPNRPLPSDDAPNSNRVEEAPPSPPAALAVPAAAPATPRPSFSRRLQRALGPVLGGMILDLADLATPLGVGMKAGFLVGPIVGFWVASIYGFALPWRITLAALAGIYCAIPGTELIPVATLLGAAVRFLTEENPAEA
jgi:hypothetical protein